MKNSRVGLITLLAASIGAASHNPFLGRSLDVPSQSYSEFIPLAGITLTRGKHGKPYGKRGYRAGMKAKAHYNKHRRPKGQH